MSVEEMVTQKSYQVGRAQATTVALPLSRRGPRTSAVPGFSVAGEGRLGLDSEQDQEVKETKQEEDARQRKARGWVIKSLKPI